MINKEFRELTDKLIKSIQKLGISTGNGNVLIAKPQVEEKTAGGIFLSEGEREFEQKKKGFARILSIPINLRPEDGDLNLRVGDYVFYTWTAENPVNREQLGSILGVEIPKEVLAHTQDAEIILQISAEVVHGKSK